MSELAEMRKTLQSFAKALDEMDQRLELLEKKEGSAIDSAIAQEKVDIQAASEAFTGLKEELANTEMKTDDIIGEILADEAQNAKYQSQIKARLDSQENQIAQMTQAFLQLQNNGNIVNEDPISQDRVRLATIKRNIPNLIVDANDPQLVGNQKRFTDITPVYPTDHVLTPDTNHETQILLIQNTLLSKHVAFQDWGIYLRSMCDATISHKLVLTDATPPSWPQALLLLFNDIDFFMRSVSSLQKLEHYMPTVGQPFSEYFQQLFALAFQVTEFSCLPSLCAQIVKAIQYDFPIVWPTEFVNQVTDLPAFQAFLRTTIPATAIYRGLKGTPVPTTDSNALFGLQTDDHSSYAERYYCQQCSCTKCTGNHFGLMRGYCTNCSCNNCSSRKQTDRSSSDTQTSHYRINRASVSTSVPNPNDSDEPYVDPDFPPGDEIFSAYASNPAVSPITARSESAPSVAFQQISLDQRHPLSTM